MTKITQAEFIAKYGVDAEYKTPWGYCSPYQDGERPLIAVALTCTGWECEHCDCDYDECGGCSFDRCDTCDYEHCEGWSVIALNLPFDMLIDDPTLIPEDVIERFGYEWHDSIYSALNHYAITIGSNRWWPHPGTLGFTCWRVQCAVRRFGAEVKSAALKDRNWIKSLFGIHTGGVISNDARSLLNNEDAAKAAVDSCMSNVRNPWDLDMDGVQDAPDEIRKLATLRSKPFNHEPVGEFKVTSFEPPRLDLPTMVARSNAKFEHLYLGEKLKLYRPVFKDLGQRMMDDLAVPVVPNIKITKSRLVKDGKALAWHNSTFGKVFQKILLEQSTNR